MSTRLTKDNPVYYKVKLRELFKQAIENGIKIKMSAEELSFSNDIGEMANVRKP